MDKGTHAGLDGLGGPCSGVHRTVRAIVKSHVFEGVMLGVIVLNCAFLAAADPKQDEDTPFQAAADSAFTAVFTLEMVLRMVAAGVVGKNSYFSVGWNWLDFVIVVESWTSVFVGDEASIDISGLKTLRVLRPLRTITHLKELRILVNSLLRSIPMLCHTLLVCAFFFAIFGIIGLHIWRGQLVYRCMDDVTGRGLEDDYMLCLPDEPAGSNICPEGSSCLRYGNLNWGITHFDNFAVACLTIFQCITLEGWVDVMYATQDVMSDATCMYFTLLILFGAFVLINLTLAVIMNKFFEASQLDDLYGAAGPPGERDDDDDDGGGGDGANPNAPNARGNFEVENPINLLQLAKRAVVADKQSGGDKEHREIEMRAMGAGAAAPPGMERRNSLTGHLEVQTLEQAAAEAAAAAAAASSPRQRFRRLMRLAAVSVTLERIVVLVIGINTIALMCDAHGISDSTADLIASLNEACAVVFMVEMAIKVAGLGPYEYCSDPYNVMDGTIVIAGLFSMLLAGGAVGSGFRVIRLFRVMRVMRVARFARYLSTLHLLIEIIMQSMSSLFYISCLLILFMFIYAVLGMQLFGGEPYEMFDELPRSNFDSFFWSFVTVFQLLTGENWNWVMYDAVRAVGMGASLYFVSWLILGQYFLLNMLMAVLLNVSEAEGHHEQDALNRMEVASDLLARIYSKGNDLASKRWAFVKLREAPNMLALEAMEQEEGSISIDSSGTVHNAKARRQSQRKSRRTMVSMHSMQDANLEQLRAEHSKHWRSHTLFLFSETNRFRLLCHHLANHEIFSNVVLVFILLSSALLAVENPGNRDDEQLVAVLDGLEYFFTTTFTIELVIKVTAMGLVLGPDAYLKDGWNAMDGGVVFISLFSLALSGLNLSWIKTLRLCRCLRPLRMINRNENMKFMMTALAQSLNSLVNVLVVLLIVWLMFGILGMQLFKGTFYHCSDPDFPAGASRWGEWSEEEGLWASPPCSGNFTDTDSGEVLPREWVNADSTFDNIYDAMITLYVISSLEGWPDIMYNAVDAVDVDVQPKTNNDEAVALFFIMFILIGAFFFVNLFVGVIYDKFMRLKRTADHGQAMSEKDFQWLEFSRRLTRIAPMKSAGRPDEPWRIKMWRVTRHRFFTPVVYLSIALNGLFMMLAFEGEPDWWAATQEAFNVLFTVLFTIEAFIKLSAFGPSGYFQHLWNAFDFCVVVSSIVDLFMTLFDVGGEYQGYISSTFRSLRVLRLLRLSRMVEGMRTLVMAVLNCTDALLTLTALLVLISFMYAVVGVSMFGEVEQSTDTALNRHANFATFGTGLLTLFRVCTGEGWNEIMYAIIGATPSETMLHFGTVLYFVSYVTLVQFLMLNLFVMIIVDAFEIMNHEASGLTDSLVQVFRSCWAELDRSATGKLQWADLPRLVATLGDPITPAKGYKYRDLHTVVDRLHVTINSDDCTVGFTDALLCVTRHAAGFRDMRLPADVAAIMYVTLQHDAARRCQSCVRMFVARSRFVRVRRNIVGLQRAIRVRIAPRTAIVAEQERFIEHLRVSAADWVQSLHNSEAHGGQAASAHNLLREQGIVVAAQSRQIELLRMAQTIQASISALDTSNEWGRMRRKLNENRLQRLHGCVADLEEIMTTMRGSQSAEVHRVTHELETEAAQATQTFIGHTGTVRALTVTPDGHSLISSADDNTIRVWFFSLADHRWACSHTLAGPHPVPAVSLVLHQDDVGGTHLFSGGADGTMVRWAGHNNWAPTATLKGHTGAITALVSVAGCVVSASTDGTLRMWEMGVSEAVKVGSPGAVARPSAPDASAAPAAGPAPTPGVSALASQHTNVISATDEGAIDLWSTYADATTDWLPVRRVSVEPSPVRALLVSGLRLYSVCAEGQVRVWSMRNLKCEHESDGAGEQLLAATSGSGRVFIVQLDGHDTAIVVRDGSTLSPIRPKPFGDLGAPIGPLVAHGTVLYVAVGSVVQSWTQQDVIAGEPKITSPSKAAASSKKHGGSPARRGSAGWFGSVFSSSSSSSSPSSSHSPSSPGPAASESGGGLFSWLGFGGSSAPADAAATATTTPMEPEDAVARARRRRTSVMRSHLQARGGAPKTGAGASVAKVMRASRTPRRRSQMPAAAAPAPAAAAAVELAPVAEAPAAATPKRAHLKRTSVAGSKRGAASRPSTTGSGSGRGLASFGELSSSAASASAPSSPMSSFNGTSPMSSFNGTSPMSSFNGTSPMSSFNGDGPPVNRRLSRRRTALPGSRPAASPSAAPVLPEALGAAEDV